MARFAYTHKHGSGAEYDHGNKSQHTADTTGDQPKNWRATTRRPSDRSRQQQPPDCDTTDFGLCGRWMDSAFALAPRLQRNLRITASPVGARTSILVIQEVTGSDFPEDPPELPR